MIQVDSAGAMAKNLNETLSLEQVLESLHCPLSEEQLWALADVSSRAVKREYERYDFTHPSLKNEQSLVLSVRTLCLTSDGDVQIVPRSSSDSEHDLQYSPEEVKLGLEDVDAQRVLVFGLGATLFISADYAMAEDEEPLLSGDMEALIGAMTDEDAEDRASFDDVLTDTTQRVENNVQAYKTCLQQLYQAAASVAKAAAMATETPSSTSSSTVPPTQYSVDNDVHHQLMDAIKQSSSASLQAAASRQLTGPAPYVTPHEQLLGEIRRASQADLASVQSASSDTSSLKDLADVRIGEGGKAVLPLMLNLDEEDDDLSDLLGDWDPAKQVQLAFAAEAAAASQDASPSKPDRDKTPSPSCEATPTVDSTPVKATSGQPLPMPTTPFVGFDEFKHINESLFKAELDELECSDPKKVQAIKADKLCAVCLKAKFGVFFRSKHCAMCNRPICSNCGQTTPLPSHMIHSDGSTPGSPKTPRKPSGGGSPKQPSPMVLLCHGCRGSVGGARLSSPGVPLPK
eukprot:m.69440 g.69440  ORF g.69440 m.69440 type:complete len:515 (-) comp14126_c0_seq1:765-2309(-)